VTAKKGEKPKEYSLTYCRGEIGKSADIEEKIMYFKREKS
jgi:hypothetical protein